MQFENYKDVYDIFGPEGGLGVGAGVGLGAGVGAGVDGRKGDVGGIRASLFGQSDKKEDKQNVEDN